MPYASTDKLADPKPTYNHDGHHHHHHHTTAAWCELCEHFREQVPVRQVWYILLLQLEQRRRQWRYLVQILPERDRRVL